MTVWLPNGDMENEMRDEYNCKGKCMFCNTFYTYEHVREENWDGSHDSWDNLKDSCICKRNVGFNSYHKIKVDKLKVNELKEFLKYHNVKGYSKLNKEQLVALVKSVLSDIQKINSKTYEYGYYKISNYIE